MKNLLFVFDVESDGLLGDAFAVGALVIDKGTKKIIDSYEGMVDIAITSTFVENQVMPNLSEIKKVENLKILDLEFYDFYQKYFDKVDLVFDAGFPVETNFLKRVFSRIDEPLMPYPIYDLMSILLAKGLDPNLDRIKYLNKKLRKHHPIDDAYSSAMVYLDVLYK